jgi:hypothetical protein
MFGTRRITSRLLGAFVFVSVVFVYFLVSNSTRFAVKNADADPNKKTPGDGKRQRPKKSHIDLVVVEEHHEGRRVYRFPKHSN